MSHFGPLHGQNWKNVSKKCLFVCPRPKSLKMTKIAPFPQPNFAKWLWFLTIFHKPWVCWCLWKIAKNHFFAPGGLWKWCYYSHFQWFWPGTTKKALFWHISSILAMKGPQTWQNSLITWKYYGKTPIEKKIGAVSFTGGWAIL